MGKKIYGHTAILKLVQIAAYDDGLGDSAKRVLSILAGYANCKDYTAFPSVSRIAKALGLTRAAVTKQIAILERYGYLIRKPNYKSSGGRTTNIIKFNMEIVTLYGTEPDIFCKRNVTLIVMYLATVSSYGGIELEGVTGSVNSKSCIKKPTEKNIIKKQKEDIAFKGARVRHSGWEQEKEREIETGITKNQNEEFENLYEDLKQLIGVKESVDFSILVGSKTKDIESPLERMIEGIKLYKARLREELENGAANEGGVN
jgi:predicted transcriptional regulator